MNYNQAKITVLTGYAQIASAIIASLLMVPLALRHLNTAEFGLWIVIGQTLGYLLLLDFGLGNSAGRILAEPIHQNDENELVSWWTVLVGALASQGLIILIIGCLLTDSILRFLEIPGSLRNDARLLWLGMVTFNAIARPLTALNGIYYVQNRVYVVNAASMAMSWTSLIFFWIFLSFGFQTTAYMFATIVAWVVQATILLLGLSLHGQLPKIRFKSFRLSKLKSLYSYSFWTFLMAMSIQAILMSQSLVVSKILGVAAVASFSVSIRASNMLSQVLWKTFDAFTPTWLRSYVADHHEAYVKGWTDGLVWSVAASLVLASGFITFNRIFVSLYARADLWAGRDLDLATSGWLILYAFVHAASFPYLASKNLRGLSWISVAEAPVSLAMAAVGCTLFGLPGLYIGGILTSLIFAAGFLWRKSPGEAGLKKSMVNLLGDHRILKSSLVFLACVISVSLPHQQSWLALTFGEWLGALVTSIGLGWIIRSLVSLHSRSSLNP